MVAIFTGLGAGFERGSGAALGGGGLLGSSSLGRGGEGAFLNAATGNLVLTRQDEFLVGRGPDASVARTYNSLGQLFGTPDDNSDYWHQSTDRRVIASGTFNVVNHTVKRISGDGSEITYKYDQWESGVYYYRATDGAGAHDKLTWDGTNWAWTDGATRIREVYEVSGVADQWRIKEQKDLDGSTLTFAYVSGTPFKLKSVTTSANGLSEVIEYQWGASDAENYITAVVTKHDHDFSGLTALVSRTRTTYQYTSNKLTLVTVDLTPEDTGDASTYWTAYGYDGAGRLNSITQKDGSSLAIGYDSNAVDPATAKVVSLTQTVATGETRVTTIQYIDEVDGIHRRTEITDPRSQVIKLRSKIATGELVEIIAPPAITGAAAISTSFQYDSQGNVTRVTDGRGEYTEYTYDAFGNVATITDANGNVTSRTYDASNSLARETRTGSIAGGAPSSFYTRFVYDSENHLRFAISAEGEVTEHEYADTGELIRTTVYTANAYTVGESVPSLSDMTTWRGGGAINRAASEVTVYAYDGRGALSDTYKYGEADASTGHGVGDGDDGAGGSAVEGFSQVHYTYDQHGRLIGRQTVSQQGETFAYDGLDRLKLSTNLTGGSTAITFTDAPNLGDETKTQIVVTVGATTYTTISVFNRAGEIISRSDSHANNTTFVTQGTETYSYDNNGQLRRVIDASGRKSYFIYDRMGRKVADINQLGDMVSYKYDDAGRVIATVRHNSRVSSSHLSALDSTPDWEVEVTESPQGGATSIRPAAHALDLWTFTIFDDGGRVIQTVLGDGTTTAYTYDAASRLIGTRGYVEKLGAATISSFKATPPTVATLPAAQSGDAVTRTFYDRAGRLIGSLNAEGYLTQIVYDEAGRKIQEIGYAEPTNASLRASGTFDALLEGGALADADADISQRWVYDGQGLLRFNVDALNRVTEFVYWDGEDEALAIGLVRKTIVYSEPLETALASSDYAAAKVAISELDAADARISYNAYNDKGQLTHTVSAGHDDAGDPEGSVTGFAYDEAGRVTKTTRFAQTINMDDQGAMSEWEGNLIDWVDLNAAGARVTLNFYNVRGELRFTADALGYITQYGYDAEGRVTSERRWSSPISVTENTPLADINSANKGTARVTSYGYDSAGRRTSITDPSGHFRWFSYNANGTLTWDISGNWADNSRTLATEYDLAGRKIKEVRYTSELANSASVGQTATLLNGGQRIHSSDGNYAAVLTNLGELEVLHKGERIWAAGTRELVTGATYQLRAQTDGDLVLWRTVGGVDSVVTTIAASSNSGASFIKIGNDGNFSFNLGAAPTGAQIWTAGTTGVAAVGSAGTFSETTYAYNGLGNVTTVTDPRGTVTTLTHDKLGRLTDTSVTVGSEIITTSIDYDAFGQAVATTDGRGHTSYAYYDQAGRVDLAIDAEGYATSTTYNAFGEVETLKRHYTETTGASITQKPAPAAHALDALTSYAYDALGRVSLVRDAEGYITQTTYTDFGEVETVKRFYNQSATVAVPMTHALDAETRFSYDQIGRAISTIDALNLEEDYTLNAYGERTTVYNKAEGRTDYLYDGRGLVVSETKTIKLPNVPDETIVNLFEYDTRGNLIRKREGYNAGTQTALRTTRYEYDKLDRLMRTFHDTQTDAVAATATSALATVTPTEHFYYDKNGNLIEKRDPVGARTLYWYDAANRLTHQLSATGTLTRHFYDKNGNVTETRVYADVVTLPANAQGAAPGPTTAYRVTQYTYDDNNRLKTVTVPNVQTAEYGTEFTTATGGLTTTYDYDARNNVVKTTDAAERATYGYFDRLNRKTVQIDAELYRTDWSYNGDGNVLRETRFAQRSAAPVFGAAPPAPPAASADDRITVFTYDKMGRRLTERRLNVTIHTASVNRLSNPGGYPKTVFSSTAVSETGGSPGWRFWTNDANGGHVYMTNADTIPQWLASGDPTTFAIWQSDTQTGSVYDLRQTVAVTAGQSYLFSAYTGAHRADVEIFIDWRNASGQTISSSFGPAAEARNNAEASGGQLLSGYKRIWVKGTAPPGATEAHVVVRKHATKAGSADSWMFVTRPQLELTNATAGPAPWADLAVDTAQVDAVIAYTYNALGQVASKREATGDPTTYTYDDAGRLRIEQRAQFGDFNGAAVTPTVDYTYNGLGDLLQTRARGGTGAPATTGDERITTYAYGAGGRLLSMTDASGFTRTYRYDASGRVTREEYVRVMPTGSAEEAVSYTYDAEGRVTRQGMVLKQSGVWTRDGANVDTVATVYNAFGEVSKRGFAHYTAGAESVLYGEEFIYNQAGRLERTNAGDGVWKYFMYDKAGNQTLMVATVGEDFAAASLDTLGEVLALWANHAAIATTNIPGVVATITKYDARNQAIEVIEPKREVHVSGVLTPSDLRTARAYNAFGETIRETNANGFAANGAVVTSASIEYAYNTMGRLIRTTSPAVSITGEDGVVTDGYRPVEHRYYDVSGRLAGQRDANGWLTRYTLLAGTGYGGSQALIAETFTPDSAVTRTKYDIHGDARRVEDGLYQASSPDLHVTIQTFDKMGRLVQMQRRASATQTLTDFYAYDGLGQRIRHWNSLYGAGAETNVERTFYDHQGRIAQHFAMGGDRTANAYAWNAAIATAGMGTFGGWTQTTTYANQKTLIEQKDVFERLVGKTDLGGHVTGFTFDKAGRLKQRSGGLALNYDYYNTGRLKEIYTHTSNAQGWRRRGSTYAYDKAGNVVGDRLALTGVTDYWTEGRRVNVSNIPGEPEYVYYPPEHIHYEVNDVHSNATAQYDALGRMTDWDELGGTYAPTASIDFDYDANGNIRRSKALFHTLDHLGAVSSGQSEQDYWYLYDPLNRVVTQKGDLVGDEIVRGDTGADIAYDAAGQRAYMLTSFADTYYTWDTVWAWPEPYEVEVPHAFTNTRREEYIYDAAGRLKQVDAAQGVYDPGIGAGTTPDEDAPTGRATFNYDVMGRMTSQVDYETNGTTVAFSRTLAYNTKSQLTSDIVDTKRSNDVYRNSSSFTYGSGTDYALGAVVSTTTENRKNGSVQNTLTLNNTYQWWDGAVQSTTQTPDRAFGGGGNAATSTYAYDVIGGQAQLWDVNIQDGRPRQAIFTNDLNGQALKRDEYDYSTATVGDPHEIWYRFAGKQMGYVGNNGTLDTDYVRSIASRTATPGAGAFRNGANAASAYADFDQSIVPINSYFQGSSGGVYQVQAGDTLRGIAQRVYGDASLWYKIADANGLSGQSALTEGQSLMLPAGAIKNAHNSSTSTPYDPGEIIGDTAPTTPFQPKPKKAKCGGIGQIILVVIAVVVTIYATAWAKDAWALALGSFAPAAAGAAGAAAGSIVSQGVGVATGIQDKFSWNAVALAAIGGGVGAGLKAGPLGDINGAAGGAIRGALGNMITQGIGVATGLQDKFSWAGVAAAGASGAVIGHFGLPSLADNPSAVDIVTYATVSGAAAIASAATRSLIEGSDFGDNIMAALPDVIGQTIGEAIAGGMSRSSAERERQPQVRPDVVASLSDDAAQLLVDNPELFGSAPLDPVATLGDLAIGGFSSTFNSSTADGEFFTRLGDAGDGTWETIQAGDRWRIYRDEFREPIGRPVPRPSRGDDAGVDALFEIPGTLADAPEVIDLSDYNAIFEDLVQGSFYPDGRSAENGGTFFGNRRGQLQLENLGGARRYFNQEGQIDLDYRAPSLSFGLTLLGNMHTHDNVPLGGNGALSEIFSAADMYNLLTGPLNFSMVQDGDRQWLMLRTGGTITPHSSMSKEHFEAAIEYQAFGNLPPPQPGRDARVDWRHAYAGAIMDAATQYRVVMYEGRDGVFRRTN